MECCGKPMSNFSYYRGFGELLAEQRIPHYYCCKCGHRHFEGKEYTADEWFFYINEETYREYLKRLQAQEEQDLFQSIHAHEIINHSNPEGELK